MNLVRDKAPVGSLIATGVVLLLLLVGPGCNTSAPLSPLGEWENVAFFYAKAKSPTVEPFLSTNQAETSATRYTADTSLVGGVQASAARIQGSAPAAGTKFELPAAGKDMYLNLSKPVQGVVYVSDTAVAAAKRTQQVFIRVEAYAGTQRLGGSQFEWDGSAEGSEFQPFYFRFRPEVSMIKANEPVSLRVSRLSGGLDLAIGTGGAFQSRFEVHYYDFDPLGTAVSVKGRSLIISTPGASLQDHMAGVQTLDEAGTLDAASQPTVFIVEAQDSQRGAGAVLVAAGAISMVAVAARRAPRGSLAGIVMALFLILGFAGCVDDSKRGNDTVDTGAPSATPTVSARYEENKTLEDLGAGAVRGVVRDENNLTVFKAHVSLLGTSYFEYTDRAGFFEFDAVAAGRYMLRVDADGFVSLENGIDVRRGQVTELNVTIVHPIDLEANKKLHRHDDWNGETVKVYPDSRWMPYSGNLGGSQWYHAYYTDGSKGTNAISLPPETRIYPGTGTVEVKLSWSGGPAEMGLRILTNGNTSTAQTFVPRKSGDAFRIAIFPNEADPGHQKFSNWVFYAYPSTMGSTYNPQDRPVQTGGEVTVSVKLYKGVIPFEPEHADRWGDKTEVPLKFGPSFTTISYACNMPSDDYSFTTGVVPQFVPPGTSEIRGTLKWTPYTTNGVTVPSSTEWGLLYKPANIANSQWAQGLKPATKLGSAGATGYEFSIKVLGSEVDQFYQTQTNWKFFLDDKDPGASSYSVACGQGYGQTASLSDLRAIRDPGWQDI